MVAERKKIDFTSGKIFSKIVFFVLPIIFTNLLQTFYNAADMMIVSLSDEVNAVGAVGTTGSFIGLIVNVFIGFSVGANVVVSRWIGAKDKERTQFAVHTAVVMSLIFGLIGMAVGLLLSRPVLVAMGTKGNLLELAVTYTRIYFLGIPFLSATNYLIAIFRAKGDSQTPLVVLAATGILNVALNFFFVVGVGLSVEGVALATAIANLVSTCVLLFKLKSDQEEYTRLSFKKLKINKKAFKDIIRVGVPAGIQSGLFALSNILIQSSIVTVNNTMCPPNSGSEYQPIVSGCAAQGNLENFTYTAMNAVYQGAITFTSQNMGANKPERIRKILYSCIIFVSIVGLGMGIVMFLLRKPLLALYGIVIGTEGSLERMAFDAATIRAYYVGLVYFLCGIMEVGTGVLRGLGKSMVSTVISLVGACLLRVVWLLTVFPMKQTLEVIYISYPITWIITVIVEMIVIHILLKKILKKV